MAVATTVYVPLIATVAALPNAPTYVAATGILTAGANSTLTIDGTLVVIGLPGAPYPVHVGSLLNGRKSLAGSMIGGVAETQEMINFSAEHGILSDIEVINADYVDQAYERTVASDVKYRFVIDASTI